MTGRYLRKKQDGPRDPTMTHVDDPYAFEPGDWVRDYEGWRFIYSIEEIRPGLVFIELRGGGDDRMSFDRLLPDPGAVHPSFADMRLFDFRPLDAENFYENAVSVETGKRPDWTIEEARAQLEHDLAEHMNGFVP